MPDNNTNLPILDDIIKPGSTDKAVHQPSRKVNSSLWSDDETNASSSISSDADAADQMQVPSVTGTDDGFAMTEQVQGLVSAEADEAPASAIDFPDLDALTEEILGDMMREIEQLLRDRIRQTLSRHFSGETRPD
jgi:hypothetical protein